MVLSNPQGQRAKDYLGSDRAISSKNTTSDPPLSNQPASNPLPEGEMFGEHRVVLNEVSWECFEMLLNELGEVRKDASYCPNLFISIPDLGRARAYEICPSSNKGAEKLN